MDEKERRWVEQKLDAIDRLMDEVRRYLVSATEDGTTVADPGFMTWFKRVGAFLNDVEQAGGRLPASQLLELARKHGYDGRGTAGFYSGAQASLTNHPDGTRELTSFGRQRAKEWRETFGKAA
jgi:hypothetical protein